MLRKPDVTKVPLRDYQLAMETARMLQRMTGDSCAVMWDGPLTFTITRQEPGGKQVNG